MSTSLIFQLKNKQKQDTSQQHRGKCLHTRGPSREFAKVWGGIYSRAICWLQRVPSCSCCLAFSRSFLLSFQFRGAVNEGCSGEEQCYWLQWSVRSTLNGIDHERWFESSEFRCSSEYGHDTQHARCERKTSFHRIQRSSFLFAVASKIFPAVTWSNVEEICCLPPVLPSTCSVCSARVWAG